MELETITRERKLDEVLMEENEVDDSRDGGGHEKYLLKIFLKC